MRASTSVLLVALAGLALSLSALGCTDGESPAPASAPAAVDLTGSCEIIPPTAPAYITHYACNESRAAALCDDGYPLKCTPLDKTRGTVVAGASCRVSKAPGDAASVFELGDDCAPNPDFYWPDWPKGSFCLEEGAGPFCSHSCHLDLHCDDVAEGSGKAVRCGEDERCHFL